MFAAAAAVAALVLQQWLIPLDAQAALGLFANGADLEVYRLGGVQVLGGRPLYDGPIPPGAYFTYPPFAALVFTALAALPVAAAKGLAFIVSAASVCAVVWRCLRVMGYRAESRLALFSVALALVALALVALDLEAVRGTLWQGQINLALMALIMWDLTRPRGSRLQGWSVGVAAGMKLTAVVFVPFLLATRQWRAATTAVLTGGATVAASWLILPADSRQYWCSAVGDVGRVGPMTHPANYSIGGVLANLSAPAATPVGLWAGCVVAAGVLGLSAAWAADRSGHVVLAISLVGLVGCVSPPLAWSHHWVWFLPLLVWMLHQTLSATRGVRFAWTTATALIAVAASAWLSAWLCYRTSMSGRVYDFYVPAWDDAVRPLSRLQRAALCGATSAVFLLVAIATIVATIRHRDGASRRRDRGESGVSPVMGRRPLKPQAKRAHLL